LAVENRITTKKKETNQVPDGEKRRLKITFREAIKAEFSTEQKKGGTFPGTGSQRKNKREKRQPNRGKL